MFKPPKAKSRLESAEEADFMRDVKKFDKHVKLKVRKLNGLGNRSWPDRMILGPNKFILFIEFKRKPAPGNKGGKLSAGQEELFDEMEELGHKVYIYDDGHAAAEFLKRKLQQHGVWNE